MTTIPIGKARNDEGEPIRWLWTRRPGNGGRIDRAVEYHGPKSWAKADLSVLSKHNFGWGFQVGRNGSESDLGIDVQAGKILHLWTRFRAPWLAWLRIDKDSGDRDWYEARHYGVMIRPHGMAWLRIQTGELEHSSHRRNKDGSRGRSGSWTLNKHTFLGLNRLTVVEGDSGETVVPMPEGSYRATWTEKISTTQYTAPLGRLRDRIVGPRTHRYISLSIPGGIPVEGKGENSWDCGMDGVMGTSGGTVEEAVANAVRAALRDRKQYGGPNDLDRPMSITEAENRPA